MKKRIPFKKLLSSGIMSGDGVVLELLNGEKIKTSSVCGYSGYDGHMVIETRNSVYYN